MSNVPGGRRADTAAPAPADSPEAAPQESSTGPGEVSFTDDELAALGRVFDAARRGDAEALRPLLTAGFTPDLTNHRGDTLLILAAYHCHEECVRLLLEFGADHGRVNDQGQTALGAAVFRQQHGIVTDLLAAGADPDAGVRSARDIAAFFGLDEMAALLPA